MFLSGLEAQLRRWVHSARLCEPRLSLTCPANESFHAAVYFFHGFGVFIPVVLICATLSPSSVFQQTAPAILCQQTCFGCRSGAHFPNKTLSESSLFWRQREWGRDNGQLSAANLSASFAPENQVSFALSLFFPNSFFLSLEGNFFNWQSVSVPCERAGKERLLVSY